MMQPTSASFRTLEPDAIQVWHLDLTAANEAEIATASSLLNPDERARARRFRQAPAARGYLLTRSALRRLLAFQLGLAPPEVPMELDRHGKPRLSAPYRALGVHFNVSHCADLALIALARGRQVGVDVEPRSSLPDLPALAERVLSPEHFVQWRELSPAHQFESFLRAWTSKEALLKARGLGLSVDPREVPLPGAWASQPVSRRTRVKGAVEFGGRWQLIQIDPTPGHAAMLAYDGTLATVTRGRLARETPPSSGR